VDEASEEVIRARTPISVDPAPCGLALAQLLASGSLVFCDDNCAWMGRFQASDVSKAARFFEDRRPEEYVVESTWSILTNPLSIHDMVRYRDIDNMKLSLTPFSFRIVHPSRMGH
jgi:hypothetical protein